MQAERIGVIATLPDIPFTPEGGHHELKYIKSMCGRFTNRLTWREIVALYRLSVPAQPERNLPGRYNICPTDTIDAVVERDGKRDLVPMRWGLVPWWWKKKVKETPAIFNARADTVAERSRCFVTRSSASAV